MNSEKHSPIEPSQQKDEAKGMSKQIMEILLDNIHFSPQVNGYVVHGVVEKMIELFKEWHNKLSSPPEPASNGPLARATEYAKTRLIETEDGKCANSFDVICHCIAQFSLMPENNSDPFSKEQEGEWLYEKPEFNKECAFVTATKYNRNDEDLEWDYSVWQIKKLDGENEEGEERRYWVLLTGDGEEWGDLADLTVTKYFIIPKSQP